ncbi:MAG: 8-amino-7-oxononanoate synthase [Gammaproteobacteria bacterium]|nr:MAG: 8-amino-7-oxononanoate synthase [Gammaproteobacteria bacterium]RKZ44630.1 MAG: 8-amino-7-oxononanoate synthase [Gammaproteobacteria bacterium]RKZ76118.1 MAG: 8-amino-7-oxononanoate synthase [Gammaproteobacteria bacterium]
MDTFLNSFRQQRAELYRTRQIHDSPQTPTLLINGQPYLTFCSNDYLGLASHPRLKTAWQQGAEKYAVGSGASHLVTGHTLAHHSLEKALADYTNREQALLFSTGYMANLGVVTALVGRHDAIFLDKLNHASLVDAALLSRAKIYRYPHNDIQTLAHLLKKSSAAHKLIITDGVFSMDGDLANLPEMVKLAKTYQAWIMVDDAHGLGVLGDTGRGILEEYCLGTDEVPVLMGTLGKAFGVFGAFVAGSELLIDTLIQSARTYIYTTALPPALAETVRASLAIADEEAWRRKRLHELIAYFRAAAEKQQIPLMESFTPIQPIILGDSKKALAVSQALYERGIIITAIRPPTVPQGTARLRVTFSALHNEDHIDQLIDSLVGTLQK